MSCFATRGIAQRKTRRIRIKNSHRSRPTNDAAAGRRSGQANRAAFDEALLDGGRAAIAGERNCRDIPHPRPTDPGAAFLNIHVRDIDPIFATLKKTGAPIVARAGLPVTNTSNGRRSLIASDPVPNVFGAQLLWGLAKIPGEAARVKGVASKGVRLGNWLTAKQAQALLNGPDATTRKSLRDRQTTSR